MDKEVKFEVLGKYSRVEGGKRVKYTKGMILKANPETVKHFMDILKPLQPLEKPEPKAIPQRLKAVHKGGGRWIVENEITHDVIHEGYLTKEEAIQTVEAGGFKYTTVLPDDEEDLKEGVKEEEEEEKEEVPDEAPAPTQRQRAKQRTRIE